MRRMPFKSGQLADDALLHVLVPGIRKATIKNDDDFLLLLCGGTGSGKSSLGFIILENYTPTPVIDFVALTRQRFAQALKRCVESQKPRYLNYDEADVIKRDAMSRWNKDIIKLYSKIRGKNIFHLWAHPTPEMIDKHQVQEVVNGMIYIYSKGSPRRYYYFTKKGLMKILEKYGNLKESTLKKVAREYAAWQGWFLKYDGPLWKEYLVLKDESMDTSIDEFVEEWGSGDTLSLSKAAKTLGCSEKTLRKHIPDMVREGRLPENLRGPSGHWKFTSEHVESMRTFMYDRVGGSHA